MYGWHNTVQSFKDEMEGTTGVLGRDKTATVTFSGDKAYANDGVVNFPQLDPTMKLTWDELALYRGWVDHESALIRYSDKKYIGQKHKELSQKQPLLNELFTTIEGVRVESEYVKNYRGAGKNLGSLAANVARAAIDRHEKAKSMGEWEEPTEAAVMAKIREAQGQEINRFDVDDALMDKIREVMRVDHEEKTRKSEVYKSDKTLIPAALGLKGRSVFDGVYNYRAEKNMEALTDVEKIDEWVKEIHELETPEQSYELAKRIIEEMQGEDDDEGEGEGDSPFGGAYEPVDMTEVIVKEEDCQISDDGMPEVPYRVYTDEFDKVLHWSDGWKDDVQYYIKARNDIDSSINTLKRKLELMIQAKRKLEWDTLKEQGKFDSRRMVGAYNADPNVYKTRQDTSDLDTAITLLIDLSGSMRGKKSRTAMQTGILMAECLDKIGVPFNITGFDCSYDLLPTGHSACCANSAKWGRIEPLREHQFKKFNDRMFDARKYMWRISELEDSGHNNQDGESVFNAAQTLAKRPENRKIMFVLSDGQPHGDGNYKSQQTKLKSVVKDIEKHMDIVGIGIMSSAVKQFYSKSVVVNNTQELPTTCLGLLREALIGD